MREGPFHQALHDLVNRSPELLPVALLANGVPTSLLVFYPDLRTGLFYVAWICVTCVLAFMNNFQTSAEIEEHRSEPKAWKTIIAMQVGYVLIIRAILGSGGP